MQHPGYVMIITPPWMIKTPLNVFLLGSVIFLLLFYFVIDFIDRLEFLWFRIKSALKLRRVNRLYNKTQHGLILLTEGRYRQAEKLLLKGMQSTFDPLVNLLNAAKAAQHLEANQRRDEYLTRALKVAPHAEIAIALTQASLLYEQEQFRSAIKILLPHHQQSPRHPEILKWLQKLYIRLADWTNLLLLLPDLRKAKLVDKAQYLQFEKNIYCEMFQDASKHETVLEVKQLWSHAPHHVKENPEAVRTYVKALIHFKETEGVADLIRHIINRATKCIINILD